MSTSTSSSNTRRNRRTDPPDKEAEEEARERETKWWHEKSHQQQQGKAAEFAGIELPEGKGEDESTMEWFARSLGKPKHEDFSEMTRWVQKTAIEEGITEHHIRWLAKTKPILDRIDTWKTKNLQMLVMKRTILLVVTADYLSKPRAQVFNLAITSSRVAWEQWMMKPKIRSIYDEIYSLMETEVLEHELSEIRKATRITRTSAGRAAEVRTTLLEHPNPWVQLQAARDIMQAADKSTAAKGSVNTNINIKAELSEGQIAQLMEKATSQLSSWDELGAAPGTENGRPVVILDQANSADDEKLPIKAPDPTQE